MTPEQSARILRTARACWLAGIPLSELDRRPLIGPKLHWRTAEAESLMALIREHYLRQDGRMLLRGLDPWGGLAARDQRDYDRREMPPRGQEPA